MERARPEGPVRGGEVTALDVLLALALTGLCLVEIWAAPIFQTGIPGPRWWLTLAVLAAAVPLLVRSRWPLAAVAGYGAATVVVSLVGDRDQSAFELALGAMLMTYAVAKHEPTGRAVTGVLVALGTGALASAVTYVDGDTPADVAVPLLLIGATWAAGREVRHHSDRAASAEQARAAVEREREARIGTATMAERSRIARELHDVVAHGVSVMGLQAAGARATLPDDHTAERAALRSVEDVGRATLDELHTMLGVLRDEHESLSVTPAPRLADLPDLCADLGAAPKVELTVQGTPRPLPAGVELSTYRVVQETLTNARRHAGAERVRVTVTYRPSDLLLEIRDDGCGAPVAWEPGHGLLGMRERAVVHGGSLEVDAAPGAGFAVQARLRTEPDL